MRPSATVWYFAGAGLVGGAAASLLLWALHNPDYRPVAQGRELLRFASLVSVFVFAIVAAALGVFWAWLLESKAGVERVGFAFGCAVAALAFVTLIVLLSAYDTMVYDGAPALAAYTRLQVFLGAVAAYLVFGGTLVGWALVVLGGVTGWWARRRADDAPRLGESFREWLGERMSTRPVARREGAPARHASLGTRMEFPASPLLRVGLSLLELPIAVGVAYAAGLGVITLGCRIHSCSDVQALGPLFVALPAAAVAGIAYWIVAMRMGKRLGRRLIWDGAALVLAAAAYVIPSIVAHVRQAELRAQSEAASRAFAYRREQWIEALKKDAHGPPGQIPPMLDVVDEGAAAIVTNTAPKGRSIALGRVVTDATAPGGWRGCAMVSEGKAYYFPWLVPGERMRFVLHPTCAEEFTGAPIEYRVGDGPSEQGWWSDSAFAAPEGRRPRTGR